VPKILKKRKILAFYIIYLLLVISGTFLLGELFVRIFVPRPLWAFRESSHDWQTDPEIGWVNRPGLDESFRADGVHLVRFRTDELGIQRSSTGESPRPNPLSVAIFGDSTVVGRVVPEEDRLGSQLSRKLAQLSLPNVIHNAGVQGYSTDQEVLLMERLLPQLRPDWAVLMTCENDLGGNESSTAYGWPKAFFTLKGDQMLQYHPPSFRGSVTANSAKPGILQRIALYRYLYPRLKFLRPSRTWQEENLAGRLDLAHSDQVAEAANWKLYAALLKRAALIAKKNQCKLVVIQHPSIQEIWMEDLPADARDRFQQKIRQACQNSGVTFLPLLDEFRERKTEGPFHLSPNDSHCNAKGYQITAEILAQYLVKEPIQSWGARVPRGVNSSHPHAF